MGFIDTIFGWFFTQKKQEVRYPIDEELINANKLLVERLRTVEGQLIRKFADEELENAKKEKIDLQESVKKQLAKREKDIREKKFQKSFSWAKFLYKIGKDRKFRESIEVVDREDKTVFGTLEDFMWLPDGRQAITIKGGKIVSIGRTPDELVYKPDSIANQIRRKKIMIPYNEKLKPVPDVENMMMHDIIKDDEGRYREASKKLHFVKDLLVKYKEQIVDSDSTVERQEALIVELKSNIREISRANRVLHVEAETSETRLSKAMKSVISMQKSMGNTFSRISSLQEQAVYNQQSIESLEKQRTKLLKAAQKLGVKTDLEAVMDFVKDNIEFSRDMAEGEGIKPEEIKRPPTVQPGQNLAK